MSRNWRSVLLIVVLATALSGAWTPGYAVASGEWRAASTGTRISKGRGDGSSPLATSHSFVSQSSPADMPLPAPYEVSTGRFRYFSQTAHFLRGAFLAYWE